MEIRLTIYEDEDITSHGWVQAKYHVSGIDDVLWTNDLKCALRFIYQQAHNQNYKEWESKQ